MIYLCLLSVVITVKNKRYLQLKITMPDTFKPLSEIFKTATQNSLFISLKTGQPQTLEDWYSGIDSIKLSSDVPEEVHRNFNRAKNTMIYSWFCYEIAPVAEQYCFCILELAFKLRLGYSPSKICNLNNMIQEAANKGIISTEQESRCHIARELRNSYAHNGGGLHPNSTMTLLKMTEIINQLFMK